MKLRRANLLASAIGLPGNEAAGLRFGTPEVTRIGMTPDHMPQLAQLIVDGLRDDALGDTDSVANRTAALRGQFDSVHFVRP